MERDEGAAADEGERERGHAARAVAIVVRTLTGKNLILTEDQDGPLDTVGLVKRAIEEREGIPPDQQRLVAAGRQLHDEEMEVPEGVRRGDIPIHLVLRLRCDCVALLHAPDAARRGGSVAAAADSVGEASDDVKVPPELSGGPSRRVRKELSEFWRDVEVSRNVEVATPDPDFGLSTGRARVVCLSEPERASEPAKTRADQVVLLLAPDDTPWRGYAFPIHVWYPPMYPFKSFRIRFLSIHGATSLLHPFVVQEAGQCQVREGAATSGSPGQIFVPSGDAEDISRVKRVSTSCSAQDQDWTPACTLPYVLNALSSVLFNSSAWREGDPSKWIMLAQDSEQHPGRKLTEMTPDRFVLSVAEHCERHAVPLVDFMDNQTADANTEALQERRWNDTLLFAQEVRSADMYEVYRRDIASQVPGGEDIDFTVPVKSANKR